MVFTLVSDRLWNEIQPVMPNSFAGSHNGDTMGAENPSIEVFRFKIRGTICVDHAAASCVVQAE